MTASNRRRNESSEIEGYKYWKSLYDGIEEQTQRIINQVKDLKEDYKKNLAENQSILGQFMKNNKPNPLQNLINQ